MKQNVEYFEKQLDKEWIEEMICKGFNLNKMIKKIKEKYEFGVTYPFMRDYAKKMFNKEYADGEWLDINGEPHNEKRPYKKREKSKNQIAIKDKSKDDISHVKKTRKRIGRDQKWGVFKPVQPITILKNRNHIKRDKISDSISIVKGSKEENECNSNKTLEFSNNEPLISENCFFDKEVCGGENENTNILRAILKRLYYLEGETKQINKYINSFIKDYKSLDNDFYTNNIDFANIFGSEYKPTTLNINIELIKQLRYYVGKSRGMDKNDSRLINTIMFEAILNEKQKRCLKEENK